LVVVLVAAGFVLGGGGGGGGEAALPAYPDPPAELTNESAAGVAVGYEAVYVERQLATADRVESYTVDATVAEAASAVVARNESGVYVRVQYRYEYSTGGADRDARTDATYLVNESAITVVSRETGVVVANESGVGV
jgi:hypothetical protein